MTVADLKKVADDKKLIIGTDKTVREMKKGNIKRVFLASNCDPSVKKDIESHAKLLKVEVSEMDVSNEEMGVLVKKPFSVSVVSLAK